MTRERDSGNTLVGRIGAGSITVITALVGSGLLLLVQAPIDRGKDDRAEVRRSLDKLSDDIARVRADDRAEIENLRRDFEALRSAGDRFTAKDFEREDRRITERIDGLNQRVNRLERRDDALSEGRQ